MENSDVYPLCDKCNQPVSPGNDATIFDAIYYHMPEFVLLNRARHLLPVEDCEGSPSRAQYIQGQPLDPRGTYPLDVTRTDEMREAYARMQETVKSF